MMAVRRHERQDKEVQVGVKGEEVPRIDRLIAPEEKVCVGKCSWKKKVCKRAKFFFQENQRGVQMTRKHEIRAMLTAAPDTPFRSLCQASYIIIMTCIQVDPWNPLLASLHSHSLVPLLPSLLMTTRTYFHLRPTQCLQSQAISSRCMCRILHTI